MKTNFTTTLLFLTINFYTFSQGMVVSAPALEVSQSKELANSIKTLGEAAKTTDQLSKTHKLLEDGAKILSTVNEALTTSHISYSILNMISETAAQLPQVYRLISKAETLGAWEDTIKGFVEINYSIGEDLERASSEVSNILSNNILRMDDADRLEQLQRIEDKLIHTKRRFNGVKNTLEEFIEDMNE